MTAALTLDAIPHRPPFLFVDKIVEVAPTRIVTTRFVDPTSDYLRGHYPDTPIMPGVLLLECCFQAGALLIAHRVGAGRPSEGVPVLTRIRDARFKRIVVPGETLRVEVSLDDELDGAYVLTGHGRVEGVTAVRVSFACMLAPQHDQAGRGDNTPERKS
ncbi:MAG: 3-hydroxyacyl-ACP dehydratase FabZ family protein [Phycisphaerae bacterium]